MTIVAALPPVNATLAYTDPELRKPQTAIKTEREIARLTADRKRLIDMRIKNKIAEAEFDQRDGRLASELRELESLLPKAQPVIDPKILASAIAGLFAEPPYLTLEEQHKLAQRSLHSMSTKTAAQKQWFYGNVPIPDMRNKWTATSATK